MVEEKRVEKGDREGWWRRRSGERRKRGMMEKVGKEG